MFMYSLFQKGFLANEGGALNQANKYLEAMCFIGNLIESHNQKEKSKNG